MIRIVEIRSIIVCKCKLCMAAINSYVALCGYATVQLKKIQWNELLKNNKTNKQKLLAG